MDEKTGQHQKKRLTKRQGEVLDLLEREALTPADISRRLKVSRAAVSKHMDAIKKAGFLGVVGRKRLTGGVPHRVVGGAVGKNAIRLHGEQYRVGLLGGSARYDRVRARASSSWVWGNRVVFYRDAVMVFSYESFYGATVEECDACAGEYWVRFLLRLENLYGVLLRKERSENVLRVKAHYGETGNELADDLRLKKEKCRVFGSKDGKEWLLFDDSAPDGVGLIEAETTHSPTPRDSRDAGEDMANVIRPLFNDLRENASRVMLPSHVADTLKEVMFFTRENAAGVSIVTSLLKEEMLARKAERESREAVVEPPKGRPDYFG